MLRSRTFYIQAKDTADNLLKSNQEVFQVPAVLTTKIQVPKYRKKYIFLKSF